jgi:hypothetical protein
MVQGATSKILKVLDSQGIADLDHPQISDNLRRKFPLIQPHQVIQTPCEVAMSLVDIGPQEHLLDYLEQLPFGGKTAMHTLLPAQLLAKLLFR